MPQSDAFSVRLFYLCIFYVIIPFDTRKKGWNPNRPKFVFQPSPYHGGYIRHRQSYDNNNY